jgi:cytochrome c-type biogenesis protein
MKPVVEELAARCAKTGVDIQTVDVSREENERIADRYGASAVPTFLFLDANGAEAKRLVGAQSAKELQVGVEALGGVSCGAPVSMGGLESSATKEG